MTIRVRIDGGSATGDGARKGAQGKPGRGPNGSRQTVPSPSARVRAGGGPGAARSGKGPEPPRRVPTIPERAPLPAAADRLPALPDAARTSLARGLVALGLADLPDESRIGLEDHLRLLLAWTPAINLTAIRDPGAAVVGHILDSLAAVPVLRDAGVDGFVDLGSGGGYPGIPLALAVPARRALLVESIAKKARFLSMAVAAVGLAGRVEVASARVEELAHDHGRREAWPAVTARAMADLADLVELAFPLLARGGLLVAWKQGDLTGERARALPAIAALGGGALEIVAAGPAAPAGHVLVIVRKTGRTAAGWPRPPAERRHRPWRG